jgi:hypothetical protein
MSNISPLRIPIAGHGLYEKSDNFPSCKLSLKPVLDTLLHIDLAFEGQIVIDNDAFSDLARSFSQ